ncbi:MAG: NUDIX hydrolase [Acidimicrobiales bacterium]
MTAGERPELCVGGVAVQDGRLLLVRRAHGEAAGRWAVPGGRVERGETMAEAVVRELMEETGLEVLPLAPIGWVERIGERHHYVIFDFRVEVRSRGPAVAGDDAAEAQWVPLDQLGAVNLVDGMADFLAEHGVLGEVAGMSSTGDDQHHVHMRAK